MNAKTDIEPMEEVRPDPPGRRLRQAREAKGLSQHDIAERLRLRVPVIDAMERDDFEHLPAPTYLRGYLRNYASQLGLSGDELVHAYNQYMGEASLQAHQPMHHPRLERPRSGIPMAAAGLGFVVLLLVVILWWINNSDIVFDSQVPSSPEVTSALQESQETQQISRDQESSLSESGLDELVLPYDPPTEDAVQEGVVAAEDMRSSAEDAELVESADMQNNVQNIIQEQMQDDVEDVHKETQATAVVDDAPALVSAEPLLSMDGLALYLQGDSWLDVRDGKGKRVLYLMGRSGKEYRLEGVPPYQVKLGNAAAVKVYYNGEPFDTAAYTEGNVARFSVGKAGSE